MTAVTDDRVLNTIGLARRGGSLAVGEEPAEEACKSRKARVLLLASDAADNTARRAQRLAERGGVPLVTLPCDKGRLGFALGRSSCALAAMTDAGLAALVLSGLAAMEPERYGETAAQLAAKAQRIQQRKKTRKPAGKTPERSGQGKQPKREP